MFYLFQDCSCNFFSNRKADKGTRFSMGMMAVSGRLTKPMNLEKLSITLGLSTVLLM